MMNDLNTIIRHLNAKADHGISVTNSNTQKRLRKKGGGKNSHIYTKADILNESRGIERWIGRLHLKGFSPVAGIDLVYPDGSFKKGMEIHFVDKKKAQNTITIDKENQPGIPGQNPSLPPVNGLQAPDTYNPNTQPGLGTVALPVMEVISLKQKEEKVEDLLELKEQLSERIKELEHKKRQLEEDNSGLRAQLKIADTVREIAVREKATEKRSPWDNPVIAKSLESLAGSLPLLLNNGEPALSGADNTISETKQLFIEAMEDDRVSDQLIMTLHQVFKRLVQDQEFAQKLEPLLTTQNSKEDE